jgi:PPOX class probable F420-dependent enzyme
MTPAEAWDLLAVSPVAVLATIDGEGHPHLVPFVFVALSNRRLVSAVDEKPKRSRELRRLENIRRDPRVTVLAHHYEADWSKLWWVRAEGTATVREVPPDTAEDSLRGRYPEYGAAELGPWIVIDVESITGWKAG